VAPLELQRPAGAGGDPALAAYDQGVELAVAAAYQRALPLLTTPARAELVSTLARHHAAHAATLGGLAGTKAVSGPSLSFAAALATMVAALRTEAEVLQLASVLEGELAATHQYLLENLRTGPARRAVATMLPVESGHAAVLGVTLGEPVVDVVPKSFQSHEGFVDQHRAG